MDPLKPPKTLNIYQLVKQTGMYFSQCIGGSTSSLGAGFYHTLIEAEHQRTIEVLRESNNVSMIHVFELTIPNPAYKE